MENFYYIHDQHPSIINWMKPKSFWILFTFFVLVPFDSSASLYLHPPFLRFQPDGTEDWNYDGTSLLEDFIQLTPDQSSKSGSVSARDPWKLPSWEADFIVAVCSSFTSSHFYVHHRSVEREDVAAVWYMPFHCSIYIFYHRRYGILVHRVRNTTTDFFRYPSDLGGTGCCLWYVW